MTRLEELDLPLHTSAERAARWFLRSGIYILQEGDPNRGAVYSHYDPARERHELIYAEATGYALSLLRCQYARTRDDSLVGYARASGDWLMNWANRNSGIVSMGWQQDREVAQAYPFDNGVCCKGLMDLYELCGDDRYLAYATRIADWLVAEAINADGSVKPVFDLDSRQFIEDRATWFRVSGSFHAKIAMSLLQLYLANKDARIRDAAVRICNWAVQQQRPDGSFPANKSVSVVNVHFHCYTVEALLYAYACLGLEQFAAGAERAVRWLTQIQRRDGQVPRWRGRAYLREQSSDVLAQVLRILCLAHWLNPRQHLMELIHATARSLIGMQVLSPDVRRDGGFFEGFLRRRRVLLRRSEKMTSWATMFAVHALTLAADLPGGDFARAAKTLF